jgi:hypothetical protein
MGIKRFFVKHFLVRGECHNLRIEDFDYKVKSHL